MPRLKLGNDIRKSIMISEELNRLVNERLEKEKRTLNDVVRALLLFWAGELNSSPSYGDLPRRVEGGFNAGK